MEKCKRERTFSNWSISSPLANHVAEEYFTLDALCFSPFAESVWDGRGVLVPTHETSI